MAMRVKRVVAAGLLLVVVAGGSMATIAYADTLQSAHYKFDESVLGSGGSVLSSSTSFQSNPSIGDTAIGDSASANYQTEAGSQTTPDPTLSFAVNNANASFGSFSASGAATATSTFQVSNYTSYGYAVQLLGNPPSNGTHTINAMATTASSTPGVEQFGVNLVANTSPTSFGTNPDNGSFGFGTAAPNYATTNKFRYVSGETIATAPKSSGLTTYTISYIVNVTSLTPGGQYKGSQVLICTGTY